MTHVPVHEWGCFDIRGRSPFSALQADWNIVKRGWEAHVLGKAPNTFKDAVTAIKTLRVRACRRLAFSYAFCSA